MSFLAAIPLIGKALDALVTGVDEVVTSDEERLELKNKINTTLVPLLTIIVQADAELQKARLALQEAAIKSGHWIVFSLRPLLSWATFFNWVATKAGILPGDPTQAFYAFGLVYGIFGTSRGVEKVLRIFKSKEGI